MTRLWLVLAGLASGVLGGMGVGGGAVLIPVLTVLLGFEQQAAQNINLLYFIPTALAALTAHVRQKTVEWRALWPIILLGAPLAALGAWLALRADASLLRKGFGFFLGLVGLSEIFAKQEKGVEDMNEADFGNLMNTFKRSGVDEKINIYTTTPGLSGEQYTRLLREFPLSELGRLEAALG